MSDKRQFEKERWLSFGFCFLLLASITIILITLANTAKVRRVSNSAESLNEISTRVKKAVSLLEKAELRAGDSASKQERLQAISRLETQILGQLEDLETTDGLNNGSAQALVNLKSEMVERLNALETSVRDDSYAHRNAAGGGFDPLVTRHILNLQVAQSRQLNSYVNELSKTRQKMVFLGILIVIFFAVLVLLLIQHMKERRKTLEELELMTLQLGEARDQALEASQLKSQFVANVSHEVRTPLAGVLSSVELLSHLQLSAEARDYVSYIEDSGKHLLSVVNDILDFSKLESGTVELEEAEFSVRNLFDQLLKSVQPSANAKNLTLETVVDNSIPERLLGDPVRVEQCLLNLAHNAVKFTESGGVILQARAQESESSDAFRIRFEVRDTGVGIPENSQKKLFQPFVQVDGSASRRHGGSGLGLSIVKRLADIMEGSVGLSSQEGQGSVFWLEIPFKRVSEESLQKRGALNE